MTPPCDAATIARLLAAAAAMEQGDDPDGSYDTVAIDIRAVCAEVERLRAELDLMTAAARVNFQTTEKFCADLRSRDEQLSEAHAQLRADLARGCVPASRVQARARDSARMSATPIADVRRCPICNEPLGPEQGGSHPACRADMVRAQQLFERRITRQPRRRR